MKYFKKEGKLKHRQANDEKVIKELLSDGWVEVGAKKVVVPKPSSNKNKSEEK